MGFIIVYEWNGRVLLRLKWQYTCAKIKSDKLEYDLLFVRGQVSLCKKK